MEFITLNRLD